jgi:hypothetical protein
VEKGRRAAQVAKRRLAGVVAANIPPSKLLVTTNGASGAGAASLTSSVHAAKRSEGKERGGENRVLPSGPRVTGNGAKVPVAVNLLHPVHAAKDGKQVALPSNRMKLSIRRGQAAASLLSAHAAKPSARRVRGEANHFVHAAKRSVRNLRGAGGIGLPSNHGTKESGTKEPVVANLLPTAHAEKGAARLPEEVSTSGVPQRRDRMRRHL